MFSERATRVAVYAIFLAVILYIAYFIYDAQVHPLRTVLTVEHSVDTTQTVEGWVIREESVLSGFGPDVTITAREGEKLSAGEAFGMRFLGEEGMENVSRRNALQLRADQIREVLSSSGGSTAERPLRAATELARAVARRDLSTLDELTLAVSTYVFSGSSSDEETLRATLAELEAEIAQIDAQAAADTVSLYTDGAGLYSSVTDGYEFLAPGDLEGLSPEELRDFVTGGKILYSDAVGKLVSGVRWYYAAIVSEQDATAITGREEYRAYFPVFFDGAVTLRVESVGPSQNGESVVVFSCDGQIDRMLSCRQAEAQLVLESYVGLRVPVEAVHIDSETGQKYVYVLEGLQARRRDVEILGEHGGAYYVARSSEFREGMEVITAANDLYDGKVVQ